MVATLHPSPASPAGRHLRVVRADEPERALEVSAVGMASTYRRRRLVAAALVVGVLLAARVLLAGLGGGPLTVSEPPASTPMPSLIGHLTYVVQPGDTLWSIARSIEPEGDVRPVVDRLAAQLDGRPLRVGARLAL